MNVSLIGMPGVGKSTVGVLLAKAAGLGFLDTDLLVQEREGQPLQTLIERHGTDGFCRLEEQHVRSLDCSGTVIATGGSVVYGESAMAHLRGSGRVVYLSLPLAELERRLTNLAVRGVVMSREQSLRTLYEERVPLYQRWAHEELETRGMNQDQVVAALLAVLGKPPTEEDT